MKISFCHFIFIAYLHYVTVTLAEIDVETQDYDSPEDFLYNLLQKVNNLQKEFREFKDRIFEEFKSSTLQKQGEINSAVEELRLSFESEISQLNETAVEWRHRQSTYYPQGPQENVYLTKVLQGGWKRCFNQTYGTSMKNQFDKIRDEMCTGSKILLACTRQESAGVISLLAAAPREDVFQVTETEYRGKKGKISNGSKWYVYVDGEGNQQSWGFADQEDDIELASCDNKPGSKKLCWHLSDQGWRCGENQNYGKWEKIIFTRD